jgi:hypothetical protein
MEIVEDFHMKHFVTKSYCKENEKSINAHVPRTGIINKHQVCGALARG